MPPPCEAMKKAEAMDTASLKDEEVEEGAMGGEGNIDPDRYALAWMHEHQRGYTDEQIDFWSLLHLLMNGSEVKTHQLAHQLLSMWQWSSATHPMSCPPAPQPIWKSDNGCHWDMGGANKELMDGSVCVFTVTCG